MTATLPKPKDLPNVLRHLRKQGIRAERVAYELDVAFGTVKAWMTGRRKPKRGTIKAIEHLYGVKISE